MNQATLQRACFLLITVAICILVEFFSIPHVPHIVVLQALGLAIGLQISIIITGRNDEFPKNDR